MLPIRSSTEWVGFGVYSRDAAAEGSQTSAEHGDGRGRANFSDSSRIFRVDPGWLDRPPVDLSSSGHAQYTMDSLESRSCSPQVVRSEADSVQREIHQRSTLEYRGSGCVFCRGDDAATNESPQREAFGSPHASRTNQETAVSSGAVTASPNVTVELPSVICAPCHDPDLISLDRRFEDALLIDRSTARSHWRSDVAEDPLEMSRSQPVVGDISCADLSPSAALLSSRELLHELERQVERTSALIDQLELQGIGRRVKFEQLDKERERDRQEQILATSNSCPHYQRYCKVKFECCEWLYGCHRCHNQDADRQCKDGKVKAHHATHVECTRCHVRQEITADSQHCSNCNLELAQYFCFKCRHFTNTDLEPYHCDKCGICRIHEDRSFHCDVCNVCMDVRLKGKHPCRPNSGHEKCFICLEDVFSGCQFLPCYHKVHRACVKQMLENGIRACPLCRYPLRLDKRSTS